MKFGFDFWLWAPRKLSKGQLVTSVGKLPPAERLSDNRVNNGLEKQKEDRSRESTLPGGCLAVVGIQEAEWSSERR